jgi:hypothetical protein
MRVGGNTDETKRTAAHESAVPVLVVEAYPDRMTRAAMPFRDDLGAAIERADRLERENLALKAKLAATTFNWIQWALVSLIGLCVAAIGYLVVATG